MQFNIQDYRKMYVYYLVSPVKMRGTHRDKVQETSSSTFGILANLSSDWVDANLVQAWRGRKWIFVFKTKGILFLYFYGPFSQVNIKFQEADFEPKRLSCVNSHHLSSNAWKISLYELYSARYFVGKRVGWWVVRITARGNSGQWIGVIGGYTAAVDIFTKSNIFQNEFCQLILVIYTFINKKNINIFFWWI